MPLVEEKANLKTCKDFPCKSFIRSVDQCFLNISHCFLDIPLTFLTTGLTVQVVAYLEQEERTGLHQVHPTAGYHESAGVDSRIENLLDGAFTGLFD